MQSPSVKTYHVNYSYSMKHYQPEWWRWTKNCPKYCATFPKIRKVHWENSRTHHLIPYQLSSVAAQSYNLPQSHKFRYLHNIFIGEEKRFYVYQTTGMWYNSVCFLKRCVRVQQCHPTKPRSSISTRDYTWKYHGKWFMWYQWRIGESS